MSRKTNLRAYVDKEGHVVLPQEVTKRYGLAPGAEVDLVEGAFDLSMRPPLTRLATIYIEPTSYCNLECRTCIRNSWDESLGRMDDHVFARVIEGARLLGASKIFFGGFGEPLSHPRIVDMVAQAKKAALRVELITNGTLLDRNMSKDLIDAGLDMLWVSLDGAKPESYADVRLGAALPAILANLKAFVGFRENYPLSLPQQISLQKPHLGVVFVAMKRNIEDLPAVIRLSKLLGATRFMVTNVLPYTPEMRDEILYRDAINDIAFQPSSCITEIPKFDLGKSTTGPFLQALSSGNTMSFAGASFAESTDRCPFMAKRATAVRWDGDLSPCLPLLHDHTSYLNGRDRFSRHHAVGNIRDHALADLWHNPEYLQFRRTVDDFDFSPCASCGGCDLSERNEEDCFANRFPTCGGCLWAQGIVQCP